MRSTPAASQTPSMPATGTFPEIPLFDLRLDPEDIEAVMEVLRSGWLTMGPRTAEFEETFAEHLGVRHAIAVSSCTAALHLAYLAAGGGPPGGGGGAAGGGAGAAGAAGRSGAGAGGARPPP